MVRWGTLTPHSQPARLWGSGCAKQQGHSPRPFKTCRSLSGPSHTLQQCLCEESGQSTLCSPGKCDWAAGGYLNRWWPWPPGRKLHVSRTIYPSPSSGQRLPVCLTPSWSLDLPDTAAHDGCRGAHLSTQSSDAGTEHGRLPCWYQSWVLCIHTEAHVLLMRHRGLVGTSCSLQEGGQFCYVSTVPMDRQYDHTRITAWN
jgi:hypothetical protein